MMKKIRQTAQMPDEKKYEKSVFHLCRIAAALMDPYGDVFGAAHEAATYLMILGYDRERVKNVANGVLKPRHSEPAAVEKGR